MYIGIDLGTSGVKAILLAENGQVIASQSAPLSVSRPHPLWSEQNTADWWQATDQAMQSLAAIHDLQQVKALGLTGQMHGATLLDKQHQVLRPAILWNDGRSFAQCQALEAAVPASRFAEMVPLWPLFARDGREVPHHLSNLFQLHRLGDEQAR